MKSFTEAALDEIEAGTAVVSGAVEILSTPPLRVWGGWGTLTIGGNDFEGVGDRGLAQVSSAALGATEQGLSLTLSGIDPATLALLDASEIAGAPVTVWRLIFAGDAKTLLDAHVFTRGRVDRVPVDEEVGGTAKITVEVEGAARGLGRRGGRMRSDADQRLIRSNDGFFKHVSYAAEKMLYWGGKPPSTAGQALGASPVAPGLLSLAQLVGRL